MLYPKTTIKTRLVDSKYIDGKQDMGRDLPES
jgi:hypothetical protein